MKLFNDFKKFLFRGNVARPAIFIVDGTDPADRTRCLPGGDERKAPVSESHGLTIVQATAIHFRLRRAGFWLSGFVPRPMRTMLTLKNHHDLVRGDGAFTENLPAPRAERKIDNGGG